MSYSWEISGGTFPIAEGTEIRAAHFETLRRRIHVMRNLQAGVADLYDYDSPDATTATWEAWVDANFLVGDFPLERDEPDSPGYNRLFNLTFKGSSGMETGDLFSCCAESFADKAALKASPPTNSSGVVNGGWCYCADPNFYHDWDEYSGRWVVKRYTAATGHTYFSKIEAYKYLPKQVGPNDQQRYVKYTDTERVIPRRKHHELHRLFLTQPSTLGPNFQIEQNEEGVDERIPIDGESDPENLGTAGWQDAISCVLSDPGAGGSGAPSDALPQFWADEYQAYFDPKLNYAYQNQVEHVIGAGRWTIKIQAGTGWGNEYILNYNMEKFCNIASWSSYTEYESGNATWYNGGVWWTPESAPTSTPSHANGWKRIDWGYDNRANEPSYAEMQDEKWGCNGSAIELALYMIGSYDWYWEGSYVCPPRLVREGRYGDPENADTYYPLPDGHWRRTHKYTFGRPKGSTKMMPGTSTPTEYTYSDYQDAGATPLWWPGIFVPSEHTPGEESEYLTEGQQALIAERHEPRVQNDIGDYYEIIRLLLNDLWALLDLVEIRYVETTCQFKYRAASDNEVASTINGAYQAAKANALTALASASWTNMGDAARQTGVFAEINGSAGNWTAAVSVKGLKADIEIVDELPFDEIKKTAVGVFLRVQPGCTDVSGTPDNVPYKSSGWDAEAVDCQIGVGDYEEAVPNFISGYYRDEEEPDEPPQAWYDWGGQHPDYNYEWGTPGQVPRGRQCFVLLDLDSATYDSGTELWTFPVFNEFSPESVSLSGSSYNSMISWAALYSTSSDPLGILIDFSGENIDFDTIRHLEYTEVAVDDELFDADGRLI